MRTEKSNSSSRVLQLFVAASKRQRSSKAAVGSAAISSSIIFSQLNNVI